MQKAPRRPPPGLLGERRFALGGTAALGLEGPLHQHCLRAQADVANHRNAAGGEVGDGRSHAGAGLDLHRLGAGLLEQAGRVGVSGFVRGLIAAEGHVDGDQGPAGASHHRLAVQDHHLHGHADSVGQTVQDHAHRVADQQQVADLVENLGHRRGIGGEGDDRRAGLARRDLANGDPPHCVLTLCRHGRSFRDRGSG